MEKLWLDITIWFGLVLIASIFSRTLAISAALVEIIVGIIAGNTMHLNITEWVTFLASFGAVVLTFLAGAEIETSVLRNYWKESLILGLIGFFAPFLGAWFFTQFLLGWPLKQAQLTGIALSTTSVAVVYSVMVEKGLEKTNLGKLLLAACFINDLGTVIALGLIFTKFGIMMAVFVVVTIIVLIILPKVTHKYFDFVQNHPSEPEVKYILFILAFLGFLALKGGSEAVLPAYLVGAVLANIFASNKELVKRLRASAMALLTPFYFLKAGSLVNAAVLYSGIGLITLFFLVKTISKFIGLFPAGKAFKFSFRTNMFNTLMMSTGLTFGTISALYGLNNGIINKDQYSVIVLTVILTAIIPTLIADIFFQPTEEDKNLKREIITNK